MATFLISRFQDETSAASLWAITAAIIISAGIWLRRSLRTSKSPPPPPGPRGLPMVGYLPFLHSDSLHRQFADLAEAHGPIYKLKAANKPMIVVSSPALAKEVIQAHKSTFSTRLAPVVAKIFSYDGNEVAMLPYGPDWAAMRKVLAREVISNQALDACRALREGAVLAGIRMREIRAGEATGVFDAAMKVVVDSTLAMLWGGGEEGGGAAPDFAAEYREATREMTELLGRANVSDVIPLLARFDLQGIQREAAEVAERFDGIITSVVQRRLKDLSSGKSVPSKDLLQILLEIQSREDSLIASSSLHFKAMIQDIASGGTESIAILLEWAMTELLSNKEAMTKIQQELDLIVGPNNFVEQRHLKELNYLNAVVKETCRLHLGLTPRLAGQPCTIGGYHIPKGAAVFVNTWAIHRDPQNWAEPLQFRPERFLDSCEDGPRFDFMGSSFQFLPFGSGRRVCVGLNLAERLMKYVLASMLHSFEWKLPDGEEKLDFSDKLGVVAKKVKPLVAIPFPRRLGKLGCEVQF
ncbi:unnamed protein product [Linum tenue]|uniref:Cytochrome P450 n=1 Tax=Linum tenue TaxID=586396 RepID=A0AAV0JW75_9ROSI|nr:unnamed protein product [Linum tenue]